MTTFRTRRRSASTALAALLVATFTLALAATVSAQAVSNPRIAEFDPSPDHWALLAGGQPAVLRYDLNVYLPGATTPFRVVDMGKPAPDPDGTIRYRFSSQLAACPQPGCTYEARVSAVGPGGAALSSVSNRFTFTTVSPPVMVDGSFGGGMTANAFLRHSSLGEVWLWSMDGTPPRDRTTYSRTGPNTNWEIWDTADLDGNGHANLLWRNRLNGPGLLLADGRRDAS